MADAWLTPAQEAFLTRYVDPAIAPMARQSAIRRKADAARRTIALNDALTVVLTGLAAAPATRAIAGDLAARFAAAPAARDPASLETLAQDAALAATAAGQPALPLQRVLAAAAYDAALAPVLARIARAAPGVPPDIPQVAAFHAALADASLSEIAPVLAQATAALTALASSAELPALIAEAKAQSDHAARLLAVDAVMAQITDWNLPDAGLIAALAQPLHTLPPGPDWTAAEADFTARATAALDRNARAFAQRRAALESDFASIDRDFRDIDDRDFAPGQATPLRHRLAAIQAAITDLNGQDQGGLDAAETLLDQARALVAQAKDVARLNAGMADSLTRTATVIAAQMPADPVAMAGLQDAHATLTQSWQTLLLPEALAAVQALATKAQANHSPAKSTPTPQPSAVADAPTVQPASDQAALAALFAPNRPAAASHPAAIADPPRKQPVIPAIAAAPPQPALIPAPSPTRLALRDQIALRLPQNLRASIAAAPTAPALAPLTALAAELRDHPAYAPRQIDLPPLPPLAKGESLAAALAARATAEAAQAQAIGQAQAALAEDLWLPLLRDGTVPMALAPALPLAFAAQQRLRERLVATPRPDPDATWESADDAPPHLVVPAPMPDPDLQAALTATLAPLTAPKPDAGDFVALGEAAAAALRDAVQPFAGPDAAALIGTHLAATARSLRLDPFLAAGRYRAAALALCDGLADACARFDRSADQPLAAIGGQMRRDMAGRIAQWDADSALAAGQPAPAVMRGLRDALCTSMQQAARAQATALRDAFARPPEQLGQQCDLPALLQTRDAAALTRAADVAQRAAVGLPDYLAALSAFLDGAAQDGTPHAPTLPYLLARQRKSDATFATCRALVAKGPDLLLTLFPKLALVDACHTLQSAIADAMASTRDLLRWQENLRDSHAMPPDQLAGWLESRGLHLRHTALADIDDAQAAQRVLADALTLSPSAPMAPVLDVTRLHFALEEAEVHYTDPQLARAWAPFEVAQQDPENRYLARRAVQDDPVLVKYAMARAAIRGDRLAGEGMRRCDLNPHALLRSRDHSARVAAFLMARFADDPVVLRATLKRQPWHPGPVLLTLQSWTAFHHAAVTRAVPPIARNQDISSLNAAFHALDDAEAAFADDIDNLIARNRTRHQRQVQHNPGGPDEGTVHQLRASHYRLRDRLRRHDCLDAEGEPHSAMAAYQDALLAMSDQRLQAVDTVLQVRPWAQVWSG